MTHNASFIPPSITPPDPLEARAASLVISIIMSVLMISIIGVVCVDFFAEMAGVSLVSEPPHPPQDVFQFDEEYIIERIKEPFELITPKHQTLMNGPEIVAIYTRRLPDGLATPPELLVDDTPQPWEEQFSDNTWFARLQLQVGLHHVRVEGSEAVFFVETFDSPSWSPEQWTWNRPHPDTDNIDRCSDCHERSGRQTIPITKGYNQAIGTWKGVDSCFACHTEEEHQVRHVFVQSTTQQCLRCHTMH